MSPDDKFIFLALASLFAVAAVVLVLSLVIAPSRMRTEPKDRPRAERFAAAYRRAVAPSAIIIGGLILAFHAVLIAVALAASRNLINQASALEAAIPQLALCGALYWVSAGESRRVDRSSDQEEGS